MGCGGRWGGCCSASGLLKGELGGSADGSPGTSDRVIRVLEVHRHPLQQVSDHGGDGGVVFGGETARLQVKVERDGDGDVADLAHGGMGTAPAPSLSSIVAEGGKIFCKGKIGGFCRLARRGIDRDEGLRPGCGVCGLPGLRIET